MRKILFSLLLFSLLISSVSAAQNSLGYQKGGTNITLLQTCADCTYNNITKILGPNGPLSIIDVEMVKHGSVFNYTLNDTFTVGEYGTYTVNGIGDLGGVATIWAYDVVVTPNGQAPIGDNFIMFLYVSFSLMLLLSVYLLIMNIAKTAMTSETILGVAFSLCSYAGLVILYWLIMSYSPSLFLRNNISWTLWTFGFSNAVLPFISLFIAIFVRSTQKKKNIGVQEFTGRRFLAYG